MLPQGRGVGQVQQRVQDAGIPKIELRRLHLPLADVRIPRVQGAQHERANKNVEIALHRGRRHVQRTRQVRRIEDLAVIVPEHGPEAPQRVAGEADAQRRHVALEEGRHVGFAPDHAVGVRCRQKRRRKAAPQPQLAYVARLERRERGELQVGDSPGEGFRGLPDQLSGSAAENQVALTRAMPVDQHAQQWKQIRQALHLVDDDQPRQGLQGQFRIGQPVAVLRVFEVEVMHRPFGVGREVVLRQRGLAALPRP